MYVHTVYVWCICHTQYGVYVHIVWDVYVHTVWTLLRWWVLWSAKFTHHLLPEYSFFLDYIYRRACVCTFELGVCVTGSLGMEVRGQLVGLHSFSHHVGPVVQTQVFRFGGRHCYCLTNLASPQGSGQGWERQRLAPYFRLALELSM